MNTYLLSWNPDKGKNANFSELIERLNRSGKAKSRWSVSRSRKPRRGDRFFIIKLGSQGRGIFGSGTIESKPTEGPHYNVELESQGRTLNYVDISFDRLVDGFQTTLLDMDDLNEINSKVKSRQHWLPENSGIEIKPEAASYLETYWDRVSEDFSPVSEVEYLVAAKELDEKMESMRRKEQSFLRSILFGKSENSVCCICGEKMSVDFLVSSHIKKRSKCSETEKRDFSNIVAPMCRFGCDELYERGYIAVHDGIVVDMSTGDLSAKVKDYIRGLTGLKCNAYRNATKKYFYWHYKTVKNRT